MAQYKLKNALPQSAHGSVEVHYGYSCKVLNNAVWIELGESDAKNFLLGGRIDGPVESDAVEITPEPVKEEKPKAKRSPKAKAVQEDIADTESLLAEGIANMGGDDDSEIDLDAYIAGIE